MPAPLRMLRTLVALPLLLLASCSAPTTPSTVEIAPGEYEHAFFAARDSLRSLNFDLDRVDASAGVVSTQPKATSGFATPWDREQSTLSQEWDDFANAHRRTVRVSFIPTAAPARDPSGSLDAAGPMNAEVVVTVERRYRPGIAPATRAVRSSSQTLDPALASRGMWPSYDVATERDHDLERSIAALIRERIAVRVSDASLTENPPPADPPTPVPEPSTASDQ